MKTKTLFTALLFLFISSTTLDASCPIEIKQIGNTVYLFFDGPDAVPGENPPATFTFPDGTTFTLFVAVVPTFINALPYLVSDDQASLDFSGEVEIWIGEEGPCYYNNGVLVTCDLSQVCLDEIAGIVDEAIDANECKLWDGDCGTSSSIHRRGRVGIGVPPLWSDSRLTLSGNLDLVANGSGWNNQIRFHNSGGGIRHLITDNHESGRLLFWGGFNDNAAKEIEFHASVGIGRIGTINMPTEVGGIDISHYRLYVEGGILTEEVRVRNDWADYVFNKDYTLTSLPDVERFIAINGHLPNVPSAKEVEDEGFEIGDMTKVQQEKIEELFLHVIEMDKRLKELGLENEALKEEVAKLKK